MTASVQTLFSLSSSAVLLTGNNPSECPDFLRSRKVLKVTKMCSCCLIFNLFFNPVRTVHVSLAAESVGLLLRVFDPSNSFSLCVASRRHSLSSHPHYFQRLLILTVIGSFDPENKTTLRCEITEANG